jgi:hypothetical protein
VSSDFDSFDQSALGDFTQSPLGDRNGVGSILIINGPQFSTDVELQTYYESQDFPVETAFAADMDDFDPHSYSLIVFLEVERDPAWWSQMLSWSGRAVLVGEGVGPENSQFIPANAWIDTKTSITGMNTINTSLDQSGGFGPVVAHPLTSGITSLFRSRSSVVSGGLALALSSLGSPLMAEQTIGGVSWVVAGDSQFFIRIPRPSSNELFCNNLFTVPV